MKFLPLLLLPLLVAIGCRPLPPPGLATEQYSGLFWGDRSIMVVIDSEMPKCVVSHSQLAAFQWAILAGVPDQLEIVLLPKSEHPQVFADYIQGTVTVQIGETQEGDAAHTQIMYETKNRRVFGAMITVKDQDCGRVGQRLLLHEMGHALGLPDIYRADHVDNVMWYIENGGWTIEDWQVQAIRYGFTAPNDLSPPQLLVPRGVHKPPKD